MVSTFTTNKATNIKQRKTKKMKTQIVKLSWKPENGDRSGSMETRVTQIQAIIVRLSKKFPSGFSINTNKTESGWNLFTGVVKFTIEFVGENPAAYAEFARELHGEVGRLVKMIYISESVPEPSPVVASAQ